MTTVTVERKQLEQWLETLEDMAEFSPSRLEKQITAIREVLAQPEQVHVPVTDNTYNYAKNLAEAIFKQHFASDEHYASGQIVWDVHDTVIGILTQIDNMVAGMVRRPAQPEQERTGSCPLEDCDGGPKTHGCWAHHCEWKAQPEQEPVAFLTNRRQRLNVEFNATGLTLMPKSVDWKIPLYTTPPQRTWVGLTYEEIKTIWGSYFSRGLEFARAVEAKLRSKNNG